MHFVAGSLWCSLSGPRAQSESTFRLTYLGNMGVLLEVGNHRVVIDGFHRGELPGLAAVPPDLLAPLEAASGRFRRIDVALTTHRHLDHYAAASVAARLRSDSAIHYVAPREVVDSLRRGAAALFGDRVHAIIPPIGGRVELGLAGIRIAALDLPHVHLRRVRVKNVGYLIRAGGMTILHVGDADADAARFAPHRLATERIDVAIVPSWFLTRASAMVRREIAPRTLVVSHVSPADTASIRRQAQRIWPGAIVLARPGQTFPIER